ncbi:MAG TPA: sigma-54 dependent transcriptional regulator [Candidatus Binataceae bacterium]|jgi:transcriptional regulator with GAF, ATPase, and Fis domain|nr:sigma-54 dependent transcriptional regulator [Candidatus Binataceae bacterium]
MAELTANARAFGTDADWLDLQRMGPAAQVGGMVVKSAAMGELIRLLARVGAHRTTVLIQGESGTGKELVAHAVHELRPAPRGPFITFNCSNLVESLAESQLFGHVKGAFTDARDEAQGYFRAADGGVLFLDEVGELPAGLQAKLLRAVEYREIQPVGSTRTFKVDVQIVAATNRDLRAEVRAGRFRADLYYRLNVAALRVPPLRERLEALDALLSLFVERCNREFGAAVRFISRRAIERLLAYGWPGNVRELEHAVRCAVLLADGDRIDVAHLPCDIAGEAPVSAPFAAESVNTSLSAASMDAQAASATADSATAGEPAAPASLDMLTREALVLALRHARGNRQRAARILGVSRTTLYRMLTRYGMHTGAAGASGEPRRRAGALRLVKA